MQTAVLRVSSWINEDFMECHKGCWNIAHVNLGSFVAQMLVCYRISLRDSTSNLLYGTCRAFPLNPSPVWIPRNINGWQVVSLIFCQECIFWRVSPTQTNMAGCQIPMFDRRYIFIFFIHGCLSIVMLLFRGCSITKAIKHVILTL